MKKILAFGEVLWDVFGDNYAIGGAPFNFASHLARLGDNVSLVTAVGKDELGEKALKIINENGVSTDYIETVDYPTGKSIVMAKGNHIAYDLKVNSAYDFINDGICEKIKQDDIEMFYFGTVAQRGEVSRNTLQKILSENKFKDVFCDINIREGNFSKESLLLCLENATILKISRDEFFYLKYLGILDNSCDCRQAAKLLCEKYPNIKRVIITLDKDGAMCYNTENKIAVFADVSEVEFVSAVGAGDSFSAMFVHSVLNGADDITAILNATKLAGFVVTKKEAVPMYDREIINKR